MPRASPCPAPMGVCPAPLERSHHARSDMPPWPRAHPPLLPPPLMDNSAAASASPVATPPFPSHQPSWSAIVFGRPPKPTSSLALREPPHPPPTPSISDSPPPTTLQRAASSRLRVAPAVSPRLRLGPCISPPSSLPKLNCVNSTMYYFIDILVDLSRFSAQKKEKRERSS